jgi:hypothetical protein
MDADNYVRQRRGESLAWDGDAFRGVAQTMAELAAKAEEMVACDVADANSR